MKRLAIILAAAALFAVSCTQNDTSLPQYNWPSNPTFATQELSVGADGGILVAVPGKIQDFRIILSLGKEYNNLANQYIDIAMNKAVSGSDPVFNVIDDAASAAFLRGLGIAAGSELRGKTSAGVEIIKIWDALLGAQVVPNNTTFTFKLEITDQAGNIADKTVRLHFTAAPEFGWSNNPKFEPIKLDEAQQNCKVKVIAPGKILDLTVTLKDGADAKAIEYIKNRTTTKSTTIDLVGDDVAAAAFSSWFPSGKNVSGKTEVTLNFGFMYTISYDMQASVNDFVINVTDANGKKADVTLTFIK